VANWPKELRKPHVLGNFRSLVKTKHKNSKFREERDGIDDTHAANIRKLPCCACLKTPAGTIHHLKAGTNERGMSVRSTDKWGVPLCIADHDEVERIGTRNEATWFQDRVGCDPLELAASLWSNRGDVARMTKVVLAHRKAGK